VIFFCSHLGSWETGAAAVALSGVDATIVTTVLTPRWLHDKITACRASVGMHAAFHPGSMVSVQSEASQPSAAATAWADSVSPTWPIDPAETAETVLR